MAVTGAATYTAQFSSTVNEYTISWDTDGDGTVDDTTTVAYGTVPTHADGSKPADDQYTYTFTGWDTEPVAVTGAATYTAQFSETVNQYTVVFEDDDGTELSSAEYAYGTAAADIVKPADPTKAYDGTSFYEFAGWIPALAEVTTNAAYTASYTAIAPAAAIGGTPYPTIQAAVDAAAASGDTIVILRDVDFGHTEAFTTSVTVDGKAVEVDLAGFEITGEYAAGRVFQATNGAALTISDSSAGQTGAIEALRYDRTSAAVQVTEYSKVIIEGGNLQAYTYAVDAADRSEVEVNGGVLSVTGSGNSALWLTGMDVTCRVNGGSITGTGYGISAFINASLTVNGGTIASTGANGAAVKISNGCQVDIADGDFSGSYALRDTSTTSATVSITDGKFSGSTDLFYPNDSGKWTATLSGGIYSADPSDGIGVEIAYDYAVVENGDPDTAEAYPYAVVRTYTVSFVDEDGTTVLLDAAPYPAGTAAADIEQPETTPTKEATAQYTYTFAGWDPALDVVTEDVTYTATYTPTLRNYTVVFEDEDGTEISSASYAYGTAAADIAVPDDPTKESTAQYSYEFAAWTPAIAEVTGDATYTATYTPTLRSYTVVFEDEDGTEISSASYAYGTAAADIAVPDDPTKESTAQFTYAFAAWTPAIAEVTGAATYTATYTETVNQYDVVFTWHDGATTNSYAYGTAAADVAVPDDPASYTDNGTIYTFTAWNPATVAEVTGAATYTAQYASASAVAVDSAGVYYATLAEAVAGAPENGTLTLLSDVAAARTTISKSLELDLGGNTLTGRLTIDGGGVTVSDGTVAGRFDAYDSATVTLAADATVEGYVMVWGDGTYGEAGCKTPTLNVYGTIEAGDDAAIVQGNDDLSQPSINIYDGAVINTSNLGVFVHDGASLTMSGGEINSTDCGIGVRTGASFEMTGGSITAGSFGVYNNGSDTAYSSTIAVSGGTITSTNETDTACGIYQAGPGTLTISGTAVVSGPDAVEVRAGTVEVLDDAQLIATMPYTAPTSNGNGNSGHGGVALLVSQHTTVQAVGATVSGGTLEGEVAFAEVTVEAGNDGSLVSGSIDGGTIDGAVTTENIETLIPSDSSALFSDATADGVPEGYALVESATPGFYEIAKVWTVVYQNDDGTELQKFENVVDGEATPAYTGATPEKDADAQYTYTFKDWGTVAETVTEDATYTATYTETLRSYTVVFEDEDGTEISSASYAYGTAAAEIAVPDNPTKESTAQYSYEFAAWTPAIAEVTGAATYTATYTPTLRSYTVAFVDEDGTEISSASYAYGTAAAEITVPDDPTKESTAQYSYAFAAWTPAIAEVTGAATYTATYTPTLRSYTVAFVDEDGTEISSATYAYGTAANDIVKPADPTKDATAQYTYEFSGWTPAVAQVTGDATYTATYSSTVNKYTVVFEDEDGTELSSAEYDYGTAAADIVKPADPTKEATAQYTYEFSGWSPAVAEVTEDATYTATYSSTVNQYTVTFEDEDGTELSSAEYDYGTTANDIVKPADPTKAATAQYTYAFSGWSPAVAEVTGDATYTATYTETLRSYTVTFNDEDGTEIASADYAYGTAAADIERPDDPEKEGDGQYNWTFAGWTPEIADVTGAATYTATYEPTVNQYTVTFVDEDGVTVLKAATAYAYGTPAADIVKPANPTKKGDVQYSHPFTGWSPEIAAVTADATYRATYGTTLNQYTVKFVSDLGEVIASTQYDYGTPASAIVVPPDPEKATGQYVYTFQGWAPAFAAVTGNATYMATYTGVAANPEKDLQVLTFDPIGGVCPILTLTCEIGGTYGPMPRPVWSPNVFLGWFTEPEGGVQKTKNSTVTKAAERTLYAHWRKRQVVTFDSNGGTCWATTRIYEAGVAYGELPIPKRDGKAFQGWFTEETGGEAVTVESIVPDVGARTLWAHWSVEQTVTFEAGGGTCDPATKTVGLGEKYGPLPTPVWSPNVFLGWYTAEEGGSRVTANTTVGKEAAKTLWAHWRKRQKVTFDANGGTCATTNMTYDAGAAYGKLPTPKQGGHAFLGWFTAEIDGEPVTVESIVPDDVGLQTLWAHWSAEQTVTFEANGGTCDTPTATVAIGGKYGPLPTPTWKDHKFLGWFTAEEEGSRVTANTTVWTVAEKTLWAHWSENASASSLSITGFSVKRSVGPAARSARGTSIGVLTFDAEAGRVYELQWTPVLGGDWMTVDSLTAEADGETSIELPVFAGETTGFFRLATPAASEE